MSNNLSTEILDKLKKVENILGYKFRDKSLLFIALTHSSYLIENKGQNLKDYEVFEFLGDAVLSLIISEILIKTFPKAKEGELSQIRSAVVSELYLSKLAKEINLGDFVFMSNSEEQQGGRNRDTLLCDVFEAVFGAIYIDSDYTIDIPREIFNKHFKDKLIEDIKSGNIPRDYKSILQILTQRLFGSVPKYNFVSSEGPEHKKIFTMECVVENEIKTKGIGKSKKEAETRAAQEAFFIIQDKYKDRLSNDKKKANDKKN